jgi:hypothetical protein
MYPKVKRAVWVWTLRQLRAIVWAADEWIHARELELHEPTRPARPPEEFDVAASRARENVFRKTRKAQEKAHTPRLRYAAGAWVRE